MKIPDNLGEYPTWEEIASDVESDGRIYEEQWTKKGDQLGF